jgi:hypothetical protein
MIRLLVLFFFIITTALFSQNAKEIVQNSDDRLRGSSSYAEVSITIVRPKWQKEMNLKSWSKGNDQFF